MNNPNPAPNPAHNPAPAAAAEQQDASRGEVVLYAVGNIEATVAGHFLNALQQILIVALLVNPLLIGLVLGFKTLWDSVTDPIMAYISDHTRSRWGRRRPYIFVGGIGRMLLLVGAMLLFPRSDTYLSNQYMETDRRLKEAATAINQAQTICREAYERSTGHGPAGAPVIAPAVLRQSVEEALAQVEKARAELPSIRELLQSSYAEKVLLLTEAEQAATTDQSLAARRRQAAAATQQLVATADRTLARAAELPVLGAGVLTLLDGAGALAPEQQQRCATILAAIAADEATAKVARASALTQKQPGFGQRIVKGWREFRNPANADQRRVIIYIFVFFLLYTTVSAVVNTSYFALGMELSPSYDGRTQVAVYRAITTKMAGLIGPWVPFFCYLAWFHNALDGLLWFAVIGSVVGILCIVAMVLKTKERTHVSARQSGKFKMGFWKSIWVTMRTFHFWRILLISKTIGLTWGLFMQFGMFLNIYWVMGSAIAGARLSGIAQTLAWATTFAALPLVNWGCRRFQKHNVIQVAVILMSVGAVLQWWTVTPQYPYLQLVMPFFTSVGIVSFHVVIGTLLADLTDLDELQTGERREGMYAAVMSFVGKLTDVLTPVLAGLMLVASGFDPALEFSQTERTIRNMRLLYTFVPGVMMLLALLLLWRYPLTRAKMAEIKAALKARHDAEKHAPAPAAG